MSNRVEFDKEDIWRPQTPAHPSTEYFFCTVVQEHKNDGSNSNINSNISRQYLSLGCAVDFETDDIFIVYGIALPKDLSDGVFCNLHTFRTDRGYIRHEPCTLSLSSGNIDKLRVFNVDGERFRLRFFEWLSLESSLSDSLRVIEKWADMNTSEKDSFRMSFLVKDCGTQELAKKAFKECFHRQRTEWEGAQANDQRVNSLSGRVRRRQVVRTNVVTKTRSMRVRVNDIVSFRNFTPQGRQVGIVCRIDKVKVGKEVMKKWFHMLTVTQNRYELVKVPEDFIYPSVIVDKDKAIFSYGAALHCVSSSSSSSHTTLTTDN